MPAALGSGLYLLRRLRILYRSFMSILPEEPEISLPRICVYAIGFFTILERLGSLFYLIEMFFSIFVLNTLIGKEGERNFDIRRPTKLDMIPQSIFFFFFLIDKEQYIDEKRAQGFQRVHKKGTKREIPKKSSSSPIPQPIQKLHQRM